MHHSAGWKGKLIEFVSAVAIWQLMLMTAATTWNLSIFFPAEVEAIKTGLFGIILGLPVPFPGFNQTDACKDCNLVCPLSANQLNLYKLSVYIDPEVTIPVRFEQSDILLMEI